MAYQGYKIAVGNNNVAGLINLEDILVGNRPYIVKGVGNYRQGEPITQANGRVAFIGFPSLQWVLTMMTRAQYAYLKTTYCAGGYTGDVTITTRTDSDSYANYNAVMTLPFTADVEKGFGRYQNIVIALTRLEAV